MVVMHVENQEVTRAALANILGVRGDRLGQHDYVPTGTAPAAGQRIRQGDVAALVLDLGLDPSFDNKYMRKILRYLALGEAPADANTPTTCMAHELAMLAHDAGVPCALLTNYADYVGGEPPMSPDHLRDAFKADAVFRKDEAGMHDCAKWVRQAAGIG